MATKGKPKEGLDKKFQKVINTPASFDFYAAIHDFIEHIESNPSFLKVTSAKTGANLALKIPTKYDYLKQIYQGLEDANNKTDDDLGHARWAALTELNKIRANDVSESNSFWKKREVIRKFATEIYDRLTPQTA